MNVGNELHTALSSSSRQTYLILTELPAEVVAFNPTFQIQYSPSHTGNEHGNCTIDFAYCMSLISAFQNLYRYEIFAAVYMKPGRNSCCLVSG